jgi:general secretion pathway protein F
MPNFRYRAVTQTGELVSGVIAASNATEVTRRMDYLRLVPIDPISEEVARRPKRLDFKFGHRVRSEDITIFTLDLSLLLKAGARLDDALELLAADRDIGGLRSTILAIRSSVLSGETFAEALAKHQPLFPPVYIALVKVGEASGSLQQILQVLARERSRAEALRRKLADALRYPTFVLFAAICVLVFFLMFVLPQFSTVLRDFGANINPTADFFFRLSDVMTAHRDLFGLAAALLLGAGVFVARHPKFRAPALSHLARWPLIGTIFEFHRTALFCRNLDVLLAAAVPLTTALRILADMMTTMGNATAWNSIVERVRQGGKLSEALRASAVLPAMAVRMLRLGEESGQLPMLAERVADYYENKLQRSLDRFVGLIGPLSIITISIIVGGLIISVMTSLLSVSQLVG